MKPVLGLSFVVVFLGSIFSSISYGALVVEGTQVLAVTPIQDVVLLPGTVLNPGTEQLYLPEVSVTGSLVFRRNQQIANSILLDQGVFTGSGSYGDLGGISVIGGVANFDELVGFLDDVVQDPSDPGFASGDVSSIIGGNLTLVIPNYGISLTDLGFELEIRDSFIFQAALDGLPPSAGTQFTADPFSGAAAELDLYIAGTDTVIGYTTNRYMLAVTAVPEPTSIGLGGLAALALCFRRSRGRS